MQSTPNIRVTRLTRRVQTPTIWVSQLVFPLVSLVCYSGREVRRAFTHLACSAPFFILPCLVHRPCPSFYYVNKTFSSQRQPQLIWDSHSQTTSEHTKN